MPVFLRAARDRPKTVGRRGVGRVTASGVVKGFKNEEDLESCLFLSLSANGHPADVWAPRFQTRSGSRKGGRMP